MSGTCPPSPSRDSASAAWWGAFPHGATPGSRSLFEVGVTPQVASARLLRFWLAGPIAVEQAGRHRNDRLASPHLGAALETRAVRLAPMDPVWSLRKGTRLPRSYLVGPRRLSPGPEGSRADPDGARLPLPTTFPIPAAAPGTAVQAAFPRSPIRSAQPQCRDSQALAGSSRTLPACHCGPRAGRDPRRKARTASILPTLPVLPVLPARA